MGCGEHSIKTRIETGQVNKKGGTTRVAESIPLKQGLKPRQCYSRNELCLGCGEHSIKTRIETRYVKNLTCQKFGCGEHSIKTRIETVMPVRA